MRESIKMRRASFTPAFKVSVDEPLIVVDESEELDNVPTSPKSIEEELDEDKDSPDNPYLLSPFRDPRETRKHSLPNIQCTSGIMASQVRRLSDGGENAPTTSEMAFLAKLSQVKLAPSTAKWCKCGTHTPISNKLPIRILYCRRLHHRVDDTRLSQYPVFHKHCSAATGESHLQHSLHQVMRK